MQVAMTKAALTPARKRLVELMQKVNFGRILGLGLKDGDPILDPPPRVIREIKIGGENGPRHEIESDNFTLKSQALELFAHLDQLENGTVMMIDIKHGLPFLITVEGTVQV